MSLQLHTNSTECTDCNKPLVWINRSRRLIKNREIEELEFRCDSCQKHYLYRDRILKEKMLERDEVAEIAAMHSAEFEAVRNRRCPHCGGPLDDFLTCDWCHESYSVDSGELIPRTEEPLHLKPRMSDFYAIQQQQ